MAETQDQQSLYAAFSPTFKRQASLQNPLAISEITKRHPLVQPSKPTRNRTRKTVYHCNGIDIIKEAITQQFSRWTFAFPADAQLINGWGAMNYGSAVAPTGTPQNEVQTILNAGATAGNFTISLDFEGRQGTTAPLAWNANAAAIKAALEKIRPIERGDVAVTGSLVAGIVVTFGGKLGKADINALTVNASGLTGGAVTVTETTKGANKLHNIARSTSRELPETTFVIGFENDSTPPLVHKGFACDAIILEAQNQNGGDLTATVELIGSAETEEALDFIVPNCTTVNPIETKDCRFLIDGDFITADLERIRYERRNNIPVGTGSFAWDDPNISLIWSGAQPTEQFTGGFYGSGGDENYVRADLEEAEVPFELRLGVPGKRATIIAPATLMKLAEPDLTFDNDLKRSVVNFIGTPHFADSINASSRMEGRLDQTTAFLTT